MCDGGKIMGGLIERMVSEQAQKISKIIDEKMARFEKDVSIKLDKLDTKLDRIERLLREIESNGKR
ncbi:MAG: hypothetical protein Q8M94_16685 [Ignavibacteria bacterium]|nr:hypothetical protein [Ignavibacteria bacterium]